MIFATSCEPIKCFKYSYLLKHLEVTSAKILRENTWA